MSFNHELASGLSHRIMEFEEAHVYDERRAYYAKNPAALGEAVEKIRADSAELSQKYGEVDGKLYFIGGITKILGGISNLADAYELGDRVNTAFKTDNWDPVMGQIAKIAASAASVAGNTIIAAGIGMFLAGTGLGLSAGTVVAITVIVGVGLTYFAVKGAEALDEKISMGGFRSGSGEYEYSDLVLVGNGNKGNLLADTSLTAKNVILIGNHHFKNLEIHSETTTVIGKFQAENKPVMNSKKIEMPDHSFMYKKGISVVPEGKEGDGEDAVIENTVQEQPVGVHDAPSVVDDRPSAEKVPDIAFKPSGQSKIIGDIGTTRIVGEGDDFAETNEPEFCPAPLLHLLNPDLIYEDTFSLPVSESKAQPSQAWRGGPAAYPDISSLAYLPDHHQDVSLI